MGGEGGAAAAGPLAVCAQGQGSSLGMERFELAMVDVTHEVQ